MSIGVLVYDSMFLLGHRKYESAMCLAMNALDATAQQEYPQLAGRGHVGERIRRFVCDHYDIISLVGSGGANYADPGAHLKLGNPPKLLEDILYEVARCSLTHEAKLPSDTYFNEQAVFGTTPQGFSLPVNMVYAVILAVVGAKTNAGETPADATPHTFIIGSATIPVTKCWGNKAKIFDCLGMKLLGPDHPTGTGLENMVGFYRKTGREENAKRLEDNISALQAIKQSTAI